MEHEFARGKKYSRHRGFAGTRATARVGLREGRRVGTGFGRAPSRQAREGARRSSISRAENKDAAHRRGRKQGARHRTNRGRGAERLQRPARCPGEQRVHDRPFAHAAALVGCGAPGGPCIELRLAEHLPDDSSLALLLCQKGDPFHCGLRSGLEIELPEGLRATVLERDENIARLWRLRFSKSGAELIDLIYRHGTPIRYEYVSAPWDLDYYQTVYAREPGSAEMPSAGRAFTWQLLFDLRRRGVSVADLVLHTGLSSYLDDELDRQHPASEEEFFISEQTTAKINKAHAEGGRIIIAVGTTVVRALESSISHDGLAKAGHGYTRLHLTEKHRLRGVTGLLTGLHEPEASHLDLLSAFLLPEQILRAYEEAIARG